MEFVKRRRRLAVVAALAAAMALMMVRGSAAAEAPAVGGGAPTGLQAERESTAEDGADAGAVLFRSGEIQGAMELWIAALESGLSSRPERARLAYNLGVAAQAKDDPLAAASWYESALRLEPRMAQARHNRELARADAGLGPAHGDGMTAAGARFASLLIRSEAEWLALGGALLFGIAGLLEAFRGRSMRKVLWMSVLLQPLFFGPLLWHLAGGAESMHMVVEPRATPLYALPDFGGGKVGTLDPGEKVVVLDELPGWFKVEAEGEGRWVQREKLRRLDW